MRAGRASPQWSWPSDLSAACWSRRCKCVLYVCRLICLSLYDGAPVGRCGARTARCATHPLTASQTDDMRFVQLFDCANDHEKERLDELISIILTIIFKGR